MDENQKEIEGDTYKITHVTLACCPRVPNWISK